MKLRDLIFEETEGRFLELEDNITRLIVLELEDRYNIKIQYDSREDVLLNLLFTKYCEEVISLMSKYNYNRKEISFSIISNLCNKSKEIETKYIKLLSLFFNRFEFNKQYNNYVIQGEEGKLEFQRFTDCIDDEIIIDMVKSGQFKQQCHSIVGVFYSDFSNFNIITSQMPGRFGGQYYHSYFCLDDNLIVDIANNAIFIKSDYYKYFSPKEVINYPSSEFENRYKHIKEKSTDAYALQITLEKMKPKYKHLKKML